MKRQIHVQAAIALLALMTALPALAQNAEPAMHGKANPAAVVQRSHVRFTVLTPRIIRMEWSPDGHFVDAPSQVFIDRDQPVPKFTTTTRDGTLHIDTASLSLAYKLGSGRFNAGNLTIHSKGFKTAFDWHPGDVETGNLKGTARTLDRYRGDVQLDTGKQLDLGQGLLSRQGWHLVDDSKSFLFDDSAWRWVKKRTCSDCQDLYFLGYGHHYKKILGDFAKVAGREPMHVAGLGRIELGQARLDIGRGDRLVVPAHRARRRAARPESSSISADAIASAMLRLLTLCRPLHAGMLLTSSTVGAPCMAR